MIGLSINKKLHFKFEVFNRKILIVALFRDHRNLTLTVNMNNLYVCHSQAQLLLACSLVKGRFSNDINDLILFVDFRLNSELRNILDKTFNRTLYRVGTYPACNKSWKNKIRRYPKDLKEINSFISISYDKVFEVCDDCIPELFILKYAFKKNDKTEYIWLEDGSYPYFQNTLDLSGFSTNRCTRYIRKIILKYIMGLNQFYNFQGNYMGSNALLKYAYLTYPDFHRKEYNTKEIVGITDDEFRQGISCMFPIQKEYSLDDNSVMLVMDKLDVYKDLNLINEIVTQIVRKIRNVNKKLYYKYHPREESELFALKDATEVSRFTGVENFYSSSLGKNITIIGIKSTSLQYAKKLGFNVISIALISNESDTNVINFYNAIGVKIINGIDELNF